MYMNQRILIRDPTIIITIRDKNKWEKDKESLGWGTHSIILREKTPLLHRVKQKHIHFSPKKQ